VDQVVRIIMARVRLLGLDQLEDKAHAQAESRSLQVPAVQVPPLLIGIRPSWSWLTL